MPYRLLRLLFALSLLTLGTPAFALLIGNLKVASYMGEPLRVQVAVSSDDESLSEDCFRLAGPSSKRAPFNRARLEMETINGKKYISIITRDPVSDPILDMTLRAEGCGATMQKDYVILLSPKDVAVETAAAVPPPVVAQAAVPAQAIRPSASLGRPAATKHYRPARKRYVAEAKAHRQSLAPKRSDHFALHLDYDFSSLARYADQVAKQRQQALNASSLTQAPATPAKPLSVDNHNGQTAQPQPTDRLVLLPADEAPQGQPGAEGSSAGNAAATASPSGTPAALKPGNNQAATAQQGIANPLPKSEPRPAAKTWYQWLFSPLILLVLALVLVLLIALWLKQPASSSRFMGSTVEDLDTLMPANPEYSRHPVSKNRPPIDQIFVEPTEAKTLLAESYMPEKETGPATLMNPMAGLQISPNASDFTVEQFDSTEHVLELAEVMLAFGRSGQAIETLSQYIRNNPNQAVEPWLKLLDLYVKADLRDEFEALATDLHKNFNVVIADWKDFEPAKGLSLAAPALTLESLPHIAERLTSTWGTPECLHYLDKLLADNRSGQRHGFSLPLVRDILLMRDILRDILRPSGQIPTAVH
jgi:pilus assembly protein FimV